jgi:hypothetical protein
MHIDDRDARCGGLRSLRRHCSTERSGGTGSSYELSAAYRHLNALSQGFT